MFFGSCTAAPPRADGGLPFPRKGAGAERRQVQDYEIRALNVAQITAAKRGEDVTLATGEVIPNGELMLGQIIEQAVHRRASDIHIEPMENQVRIRFRVDGVLHEAMRHDISLHAALIARIKIVSGLDISEKRRPQDGRATSIVDRQEYDIRVSVLPTVYGEKVVMRLAQKKAQQYVTERSNATT